MNQEILNYIAEEAAKMGLTLDGELEGNCSFDNEFTSIDLKEDAFGVFYFSLWNMEIRESLLVKFPIPDSLEDFKKIAELLQIFPSH